MKRNVLVFGLISGVIISAFMAYSTAHCYATGDFEGSEIVGYASMIVAFSMIFVGVRNYRDKFSGGTISFKKAFLIGLGISAIAGVLYVAAWAVNYNFFMPDFMEKYVAYMERTSPGEPEKIEQMETLVEWYKNPLYFVLLTFIEVFPVGLVMSLVIALFLKRRPDEQTPDPVL